MGSYKVSLSLAFTDAPLDLPATQVMRNYDDIASGQSPRYDDIFESTAPPSKTVVRSIPLTVYLFRLESFPFFDYFQFKILFSIFFNPRKL